MKLIVAILFFLTILIPSVFSDSSKLNYLYFTQDENSKTNKISFEIIFDTKIESGDLFEINLKYNGKSIGTICNKKLEFDNSILFRKIICEVKKFGDGEYLFDTSIKRNNKVIYETINKEYIFKKTIASLSFKEENSTTIVIIEVNNNLSNQELVHEIPKSVILKITNKNKASLQSSREFRIIKEDPIIAWDLNGINDENIEYRVPGKINSKVKGEFKIKVQEKTKETKTLEYAILGVILLIIILVLKPLFKKKE